ncbi:MAG: HNH endonuclease [Methylococcales bacterium]|nr:MAG: HNH endonuclease [Methylococcales bacterium]
MNSIKIAYRNKVEKLSNNELSKLFASKPKNFLMSKEWKELRKLAKVKYGVKCLSCGSTKNINIDHVKPRKFYPELALDINNLQTLCGRCNKIKGNKIKDFRS